MFGIEHSWRMRWPFTTAIVLLTFGWASAWVIRRNGERQTAYERVASSFELPFMVEGRCNTIGANHALEDGQREIEWETGWRSAGPLESGLESGSWSIVAPDGSVRARFEMRSGEQEGPCEFWDGTGTRRVHGQFHESHRVGIWTLDNVLGEGRTRIYFGH